MNRLKKISKFFFIVGIIGVITGVSSIFGIYYYLEPDLPSIDSLKDVQLQVPLRIYSKDGLLISEYGEKKRIPLEFEQVPEQMVQAFLAAEDDRFYEHPGVDYQGLIRAAIQLALTGKKTQGGSTITMQVARNFFLSKKKTYLRKVNEIFLALKIDNQLSKNDVLTLYLNKIYLGQRAYGVGAAAQVYYGKSVDELELAEIAMIAGLPKAPSSYNPIANPQRATIRRNYVLNRMRALGWITAEAEQAALDMPVTAKLNSANIQLDAPYIAEMARAEIFNRFGEESYSGGYSVYTSIDSRLQHKAIEAVHKACNDYDKRHGYRGPIAQLENAVLEDTDKMDLAIKNTATVGNLIPAIVTRVEEKQVDIYLGQTTRSTIPWEGLSWARSYISEDRKGPVLKHAADVLKPAMLIYILEETAQQDNDGEPVINRRLAQLPDVNSALLSLDPNDGAITSLVGGYDYYQTKFNRVTQAKRQPGSGFKAFIYSAALENGYTAASLINDAPVVFEDADLETAWRPENYSGKFFGQTRLRYALTKSRNLVSIRLLRAMGLQNALDHIEKFGFSKNELPHNLSLALGSANLSPLQMARGYSVLANGGYLIDPYLVTRIENKNDGVIFEAMPRRVCDGCKKPLPMQAENPDPVVSIDTGMQVEYAPRVISRENRFIMYSMMQDVITRGTATGARVLKRKDLAGKTGTTNDQRDAWFNGYNQSIVTIAWVGFDNNRKLGRGEVGGKAALPGWVHFMRTALQYFPEDNPPAMPAGMLTIRIDPESGKLASTSQTNAIFEIFRADHAPTERAMPPGLPVQPQGNPQAEASTAGTNNELF